MPSAIRGAWRAGHLAGKAALSALDMSALGFRGRVPSLPPFPRTRPGLTSAAPGLPPARFPTASCARRSSSNSGSNSGGGGRPRQRPRPRVAGLACPISGPSRPQVPCTPALLGPAPAVTRAPSATAAAASSRRPRAAPAPPAPPRTSPAYLVRTIAWQLQRRVEQLGKPGWGPTSSPRPVEIPGVQPHARAYLARSLDHRLRSRGFCVLHQDPNPQLSPSSDHSVTSFLLF